LDKSAHVSRLGKKGNLGFGLPAIAVSKIGDKKRVSIAEAVRTFSFIPVRDSKGVCDQPGQIV